MKLKQKDLKDLANKINEIAELEGEDQIDPSQSYDDLYQDLVNAVAGSEDTENNEPEVEILEDDKEDFTENQWNILAELGCPAAGGESEEEEEEGSDEEDETEEEEEPDDDEEEEGEDEDEEDEPEEEEDEVPSEDEIKSMKKKDLKQVVEDHELQVDTSQKLDALRDEVIDALHGSEEEEEEEEEPEEEEEAEEGVTYEDLQKMTKKKDLKTVIEEYELDVDASDYKKVDDLREAIAEALELVEPEEGEEEEEPEEEELTLEDLNKMTKKNELKQVIKDNDLDVDASEYKKVNDLRDAVAEALDLAEEEEEEAEVPAYDEIMAMAKKSLKQVIEEHELDIDPDDHKKAELQKVVAKALGYEVEEKKSKQKSGSKEKGSKKGEKKESKVKKIAELLLEKDGKSTPRELVEEAENRGLSPSTMRSALSHCKKEDQLERYHMPEVIVKDEDTGIIMLKSTYDKKKKKSSASKGKKDTSKSSSKGSSKGTKKGKK